MELDRAQVDLPDACTVRVRRNFAAKPAMVWRAFTEPALMQRWLTGYAGWEMSVCEMDVRVGGTYRWRWRNLESGAEFGFFGAFSAVEPPHILAHGEEYDPGTVGGSMGAGCEVRTAFAAADGGTLMTATIVYVSEADRDAALATGMTDGMEASYARLDAELPTLAA